MNIRKMSSASPSSEMENLHCFNNSRVLVTPVRPIQPQTMPICEEARVGSQLGQVPWSVPNGEIHPPGFLPGMRASGSAAACNNSYGYFDINQSNNWEEAVHPENNNFSTSNMELERFSYLPFGDLLALADNMGGPTDTNLHANSNFHINSSSLMSMIGNTAAPDELHNGSCLPSEIACDLNFPPPTISEPGSTSKFFFTNLAPETPQHSNKTVINNQVLETPRMEIKQGVNDKSFQVPGVDNLRMGVTPVIDLDLNKTPNQKPKRRKHRPKVVREGQPKKTPKQVPPNKPPSTKRKYVRKNTTEKAAEGITGNTNPTSVEDSGKSSKRKLDFITETEYKLNGESFSTREVSFNVESQAQNFSTRVESSSTMQQLEKATEITVEKTNAGEIQLNVFSNKSIQKSTPRSPNGSNCSSNEYLTRGKQRIGLERGQYPTSDVAVPKGNNMTGNHYNSLHGYLSMLPMYPCDSQNNGINFPSICKRKRSEKVNYSPIINAENGKAHAVPYHAGFYTQKSNLYSPPQFTRGSSPSFQNLLINVQGGQPPPPPPLRMPLDHLWRMTKKRSKGPTKVRDMASLMGIAFEDKQLPPSPVQVPALEKPQEHKSSRQLHTCMEALAANNLVQMKTKKRTRRPQIANVMTNGFLGKGVRLTVDVVSEMLSRLDINKESIRMKKYRGELVPYKVKKVDQNALVVYQRDGTIMPYVDIKKKPTRPKVDIDEETNRVWKLLLENINSEGINGTDEEKVKWWDDERTVFQGRADSFIARMHLVQGDRRFSPWKGSVVDSVVGVFLTQNVSDHLSSSAFMSLAARFPIKIKIYPENHFEEVIPLVEEPEICIEDGESALLSHEGKSSQPNCTIGDIGMYSTLPAVKEMSQIRGTVESSIDDKRQQDEELSPQSSVVCSNNSVGSFSHPAERLGPCMEGNLEADQTIMSNPNGIAHSASCVELIRKAGTLLFGVQRNEHNPEETMSYMQNHNTNASNPAVPSRNIYPQMTSHYEAEANEYLKTTGIESKCHNNYRKSGENCRSEPSAITEESVHLPIGVKMMPETIYEASRSRNENNHNNSCEGKLNNMHYHQYMPVWDINCMEQTAEEQHSNHRQQVLEVQSLQKESLPVSESTSAINGSKNNGQKAVDSGFKDHGLVTGEADGKIDLIRASKTSKGKTGKGKKIEIDWDILRKDAQCKLEGKERSANTMNTVDWEAVRCANVNEIADTIKERGMNNMLAGRIQAFLNRLVKDHGSIDLEWLREVPPDKAKEYLLSFKGLGLKSVECVRLLTLHHVAFPVDTNVGRIAVRLGWVPIQPLPESLQLHLLELYPVLESIQRYLWPRLCKLDQKTLYELHYQMITFGKVFCSKSKPNCNACPMRGECRHFASAFASARLSLPAPEEKRLVSTAEIKAPNEPFRSAGRLMDLPPAEGNQQLQVHHQSSMCEPIIEVPTSPEPTIEVPSTPETEIQKTDDDIEDSFSEDPEEIPTIRLNIEEFTNSLQNYMQQKMELMDSNMSKALVALTPEAASLPTPKLKNVSRLRTEHQVYELPDSHHLLEGLDKREPDDPCSYMLAIWTPGETPNSIQPPESRCNAQESGGLCNETTCFTCNSIKEANSQIVRGTILIPCRTAMRGSFPLNGTYFQVNEVFADHASSLNPINIPRDWIWNLPRRTVYFGTSIPSIFKGQSTQSIQQCFWRGFVCVRGFDQKTRSPRPLIARLHFPASKLIRTKGKSNQKEELPTSNS